MISPALIGPIAGAGKSSSLLNGLVLLADLNGSAALSAGAATVDNPGTTFTSTGALFTQSAVFSANYIRFNADAAIVFGTGDFTQTAWIFPTNLADSYEMVIAEKDLVPYFAPRDDRLQFYNGGAGLETGTGFLTQDVWQHIAITREAGTATLWRDGTAYGTTASQAASLTVGDWYIGQYGGSGTPHHFHGRMQQIGMWNRVLTSGEMTALYNGGAGSPYPFT